MQLAFVPRSESLHDHTQDDDRLGEPRHGGYSVRLLRGWLILILIVRRQASFDMAVKNEGRGLCFFCMQILHSCPNKSFMLCSCHGAAPGQIHSRT